MVSRAGARRSLCGWVVLLVLLLLGAMSACAEEAPPPPPPARDWSKTASKHGGLKLNPSSKWVQYVVGGEIFYVKDDDWSTRKEEPVRRPALHSAKFCKIHLCC